MPNPSGAGTGVSTVTGNTTNFHIFSLVYDGTQSTNAGRLKFRYDKAQQNLTYTGTVGSTTSATASKFNIGWYSTTSSEYWAGDIAELQLYTKTLTTGELTTAENYLTSHWGL